MKSNLGKLIVFEGVDAVGKTTLCNHLCDFLTTAKVPFKMLHFPGKENGTLGGLVNKIHHNHRTHFEIDNINPCSLQLLHIAAHIDTIETNIVPALQNGEWVVLDRFWWSTYVYGRGSGVDESRLNEMISIERTSWGSISPDIIFLIDSDKPLRGDEKNTTEWHDKRNLYKKLKDKEKNLHTILVKTDSEIGKEDQNLSEIISAVQHLRKKVS